MDNKRNIIALTVVIGLSFIWLQAVWPWLAKKNHWINDQPPPPPAAATSAHVASTVPTTARSTTGPATTQAVVELGRHADGVKEKQSVTLGSTAYNDDQKPQSPFPIGLVLTTHGAGIESAALNRYHEAVNEPSPYVFQKPLPYDSPLATALTTRWIAVDGTPSVALDSLEWKLASSPKSPAGDQSKATFEAEIKDDTTPLLRVTKTYELRQASDKNTAGYEVLVTYDVQNQTASAHNVRFGFNGPTVPHIENNRDIAEIIAGFDGGRLDVSIEHTSANGVKPEEPLDLKAMGKTQFLWSGIASAYFNAIVRPTDSAGKPLAISLAKAHMLGIVSKDPESVALEYETADIVVPPNGSNNFALNVYLGPKLRKVLKNDYYSAFPLGYDETLVLRSSGKFAWICGLCTWSWLINILVGLLNAFHYVLRDWGLSIVALVLVVRLLLHPITKSSQVSMARMGKLGPEMERLKKKYGDDTEGLKKAQVEFYREQGIAPFLGCLPMFLQMPIWIALWSSLQSTFEIRQAPFLQIGGHSLTWIHDLAQPDRLIAFKQPVSLLFFHIDALNLLPILMGIVFYINQKFMPQPMAATPEQRSQQKMMQWMSFLMMPIFLYTSPSGLNLYIFTSTLIGIFESKRIRTHIKQKEEREASGAVIVDASGGRAKAKGGLGAGLANFFAKMQQMAEEAKREQEKQKKKKR